MIARCLTALVYDTGLRASTVSQLRVSNVTETADGRYEMMVRGEFLKGNKQDVMFYVLFEQTIPLLRTWIHVTRPIYQPKTDRLFVSKKGDALTRTGIRNIVRNCCKSLSIRTVKGKTPSPHTLRHTLATLNTAPFGKSLDVTLMQKRLVHMDLETLTKIYVHDNPLAEMEAYKRLLEKGSRRKSFGKISREDFFEVLDSLAYAKPRAISEVKRAFLLEIEQGNISKERDGDKMITELEAIEQLSPFRIDYRSLRRWALREGFCRIESLDKRRKRYLYRSSFINDLVQNYLDKEEAFNKFQGKRSAFYNRLKMCRIVRVGQHLFIPKDDFLRFLINTSGRTKKGRSSTYLGPSQTHLSPVGRFAI